MKKHERYLTERDLAILRFVARYRIGTEEMFSRDLNNAGYCESWDDGCPYYTRRPAAAESWGSTNATTTNGNRCRCVLAIAYAMDWSGLPTRSLPSCTRNSGGRGFGHRAM